jgi:uncharacterized protein YgiM (DUF1202 family)
MRQKLIILISILFILPFFSVIAQERMWVSSSLAKLKAGTSASSETITHLSLGTEVTILGSDSRWYKVLTPSQEEGWIYRGHLSDSPPAEEVKKESDDLFTMLPGSSIGADEADTARSIRGLSEETEQYANNRGTPAEYRQALDSVLALEIKEKDLEAFLRSGRIGEYAE